MWTSAITIIRYLFVTDLAPRRKVSYIGVSRYLTIHQPYRHHERTESGRGEYALGGSIHSSVMVTQLLFPRPCESLKLTRQI